MPDVSARAEEARLLYTVNETKRLLSVSHAQLYRIIKGGQLDARKVGTRTLITATSIEAFAQGLPKLAPST